MSGPKSLAQRVKELEKRTPKDFDPEDVGAFASDSDNSDSDDDAVENAARGHYESVGKSKLRRPEEVSLGPQYAGARVKRNAVRDDDEDDEDDPFSRDFGSSDSEDDTLADVVGTEGVQSKLRNGHKSGMELDSDEEEDSNLDDGEDGNSDDNDEDDDENDDEDDDEDEDLDSEDQSEHEHGMIDRSELRKLMADDQKSVAATLTQSTKADAEKGKAVKAQRATFDALLNSRIKVQKALVATNSLLAQDNSSFDNAELDSVVKAAEHAAVNLWNNINSLRQSLQAPKAGEKRSHREFTHGDSLDAIWDDMQLYEQTQKRPRTTALDFWASKTRSTTTIPNPRGRLQQPVKEQQLSDVLAGHLADMDRLVSKTLVPRSCAPVQAATVSKTSRQSHENENSINGDAVKSSSMPIYDDADFYTTLLANLISQRSADNTMTLSNLSIQPWQAAREAKTKKVVDTKASKGRKLRYTVHEKLVSFMAPEDRGSWGERQADELFGSLFGKRIGLGEELDDGDDIEEDREMEGLRLFGGR